MALLVIVGLMINTATAAGDKNKIIHGAEYYIIESQHGETWKVEDAALDSKLAELRKKYGSPLNILHFMWDDTFWGDVGAPEINKVRDFSTPNFNRMADEGIHFTRMYTGASCTPSRAATLTGRHAVRTGKYKAGFPV